MNYKNILGTFAFVIGLLFSQSIVVHATDYNYLPADVGIKQREALSALEYRLQTLESQISNNPSSSLSTINSRISTLESERDVEINYIRGLYAKNGISNQADAKVAEITAKYASQISDLESQKSLYQSQIDNSSKDSEIADLKLQIKKLKLEMQNSKAQSSEPQATIYDLYNWLETLSPDDWSAKLNLLKITNPENYKKIEDIYRIKHPEYFVENSPPQTTQVVEQNTNPTPVIKKVEAVKKIESKTEEKVEATTTPMVKENAVTEIEKPEPPKETFIGKILNVFKKLIFWR